MDSCSKPANVIYILGVARSGSTILEILLSNGKKCFGAGELTYVVQDGFIENRMCACHERFSDCQYWGEIKNRLDEKINDYHEWSRLQLKIDWHSGFLRQLLFALSKQELNLYKDLNCELLKEIQKSTGAETVIDSSKYAGRALALSRILEDRLHVICLTRSPEGLMESFQKQNKDEQKSKSPLSVVVYYFISLASLRVVSMLLRDRVHHVRYETLVEDPVDVLESIGEKSGVDFSSTCQILQDDESFDVGHLVTGNRLRFKGQVKFSPQHSGDGQSRLSTRLILAVMRAWRWLLRF